MIKRDLSLRGEGRLGRRKHPKNEQANQTIVIRVALFDRREEREAYPENHHLAPTATGTQLQPARHNE